MPHRWPEWWEWDLELSPHLLKRMIDRQFTEIDLRKMMQTASKYRHDLVEGRWVIEARGGRRDWEVIVEPDPHMRLLVIVTAYPLD